MPHFSVVRDASMSVDFKQKSISDARFNFSDEDLETLLGMAWHSPKQLNNTQKASSSLPSKTYS